MTQIWRAPAGGAAARWLRVLAVLLSGALSGAAAEAAVGSAAIGYPGRFAPLRNVIHTGTGVVTNRTYSMTVERVIKVHAVVPEWNDSEYGAQKYAGSFALRTPEGRWSFELPAEQRHTDVTWPGRYRARVGQTIVAGDWRGRMTADMAADYPALWVTVERSEGEAPMRAGLLGWGWAELTAPRELVVEGGEVLRPVGEAIAVAPGQGERAEVRFDGNGYTGVLVFGPAPVRISADASGLYWRYDESVASARIRYILLPDQVSEEAAAAVIDGLAAPPDGMSVNFGCTGGAEGEPWVEFTAKGSAIVPIPPTCSDLVTVAEATAIDTAQGTVALIGGGEARLVLEVPPLMGARLPRFKNVSAERRDRIEEHVGAIVAHQDSNGSFSFSLGRAFYDGITLCTLAETLQLLSERARREAEGAIEPGLEHLWRDQTECDAWPGITLPPETRGCRTAAVDYPEIASCLLQAAVLYAEEVDGDYPRRHWPEIERQFDQIRSFMTYGGTGLAHPGPEYSHVIAESAIGGYLAWESLWRLSLLAERPDYAAEARGRAALAWKAWKALYHRRPQFGARDGVINGIKDGALRIMTEPPWAYVQSTFFSHLPCFALPHDDVFGVWRMLEKQPWWEYTGELGSTQRVYDACNAIALVRAGRRRAVAEHWDEVTSRPYVWNTFDETPALEIAALAWLSESGL